MGRECVTECVGGVHDHYVDLPVLLLFRAIRRIHSLALHWLGQCSVTYAAHFSAARVVTGQWIVGIGLIREDRVFTDERGKQKVQESEKEGVRLPFKDNRAASRRPRCMGTLGPTFFLFNQPCCDVPHRSLLTSTSSCCLHQ